MDEQQRLRRLRWIWWASVAGLIAGRIIAHQPPAPAATGNEPLSFSLMLVGSGLALATAWAVWRYRKTLTQLSTVLEAEQRARVHLAAGMLGCLVLGIAGAAHSRFSGGFAGLVLQGVAAALVVALYPWTPRRRVSGQRVTPRRSALIRRSRRLRKQDILAYLSALAAGIVVVAIDAVWAPFSSPAGERLFDAMLLLPGVALIVVVLPLHAFMSRRFYRPEGDDDEYDLVPMHRNPFLGGVFVVIEWLTVFVVGQLFVWVFIVLPAHHLLK